MRAQSLNWFDMIIGQNCIRHNRQILAHHQYESILNIY